MLKSLAVLAFLLAALPIISGEQNKASGQKQNSGKESQPPIVPLDGRNKQSIGVADQSQPKGNTPGPYKALERPDWWLVIFAALTGSVIAWQSWETRKAAIGSKEAAEASLAQIEFMKSKERAQLRIEFARPDFSYNPKVRGYSVSFRITLDGTTRAYILEDSIFAYLSKSKRTETVMRGIGIPRILTPNDSPYDEQTIIHNAEGFPADIETEMNNFWLAERGKDGYTLFADGRIWYRDIFGDEWVLDIDRYWDAAVHLWGPVGSGRGDTHRKVEPHKRSQKTN